MSVTLAIPLSDHPILEPLRDTELLQLVFRGECVEGHDPQAVRAAVVAALKLDAKHADRLFSGRRVVLRRAVDVPRAHRYIARLAMLGAVVHAEAALPGPSVAEPKAAEPSPAVSAVDAVDVDAAAVVVALPAGAGSSPATVAPVPWRRLLRWTGLGMAGSVAAVMMGLLLGPGLGMLWPEPLQPEDASPAWRPAVEASPAAALHSGSADPPVMTAPAGAAMPAAVADADLPPDMTPEAMREYRQLYLPARDHKAFAISAARLHAWHAGAASSDSAREAALARCMATLRPGDDGCRVIDADGELLE